MTYCNNIGIIITNRSKIPNSHAHQCSTVWDLINHLKENIRENRKVTTITIRKIQNAQNHFCDDIQSNFNNVLHVLTYLKLYNVINSIPSIKLHPGFNIAKGGTIKLIKDLVESYTNSRVFLWLDVNVSITADKFAPVKVKGAYINKENNTFMTLSPSHQGVNIQILRQKVESDLIDLLCTKLKIEKDAIIDLFINDPNDLSFQQYSENPRSMYEDIERLKRYIDQPQVLKREILQMLHGMLEINTSQQDLHNYNLEGSSDMLLEGEAVSYAAMGHYE